jgi:hypothetical protein
MEIYADIRQKVQVNPKDVIEKLIEEQVGWHGWAFEKDNLYYRGFEQSAGSHSYDEKEEITKEKYDYIRALQLVLENLKSKK